jgi:hypothetical protein
MSSGFFIDADTCDIASVFFIEMVSIAGFGIKWYQSME